MVPYRSSDNRRTDTNTYFDCIFVCVGVFKMSLYFLHWKRLPNVAISFYFLSFIYLILFESVDIIPIQVKVIAIGCHSEDDFHFNSLCTKQTRQREQEKRTNEILKHTNYLVSTFDATTRHSVYIPIESCSIRPKAWTGNSYIDSFVLKVRKLTVNRTTFYIIFELGWLLDKIHGCSMLWCWVSSVGQLNILIFSIHCL